MDPFAGLSDDERALLRPAPLPERVEPMKAVLTDERFSDPDWIYERKLDGIRCVAIKDEARARLVSRNGLSLDARFPEVVAALDARRGRGLRGGRGGRGLRRVRRRASRGCSSAASARSPVFLYVFDLLHLAGHDTTALPLRARKGLLRRALSFGGPVRLTPHRNRDGEELFREACRQGLGGR